MTVFFTSDTHFAHARIVELCKRPFSSVEEMDHEMIKRWNQKVQPSDTVFHLGDFSLKSGEEAQKYLSRLNGTLHLIHGNHDRNSVRALSGWVSVSGLRELHHEGRYITLCHYSMRVWNGSHRGSLMLYGHSHGTLPGNTQSLDVGVDAWDFQPVTLEEILARMATLRPYKADDTTGLFTRAYEPLA